MITVRAANERDADALSAAMRASIRELCTADHKGDAAAIDRWTANKEPAEVARWLADSSLTLVIAEIDGQTAGLGGIDAAGEIILNYVSPAHRFAGVSRKILRCLEDMLRDRGFKRATLSSTETAHRFYRDAGWQDAGAPGTLFGLTCYPMTKDL